MNGVDVLNDVRCPMPGESGQYFHNEQINDVVTCNETEVAVLTFLTV